MEANEARDLAVKKLISIYGSGSTNEETKLVVIEALGNAGGIDAAKKLISIYDSGNSNTRSKLEAVKALGKIGNRCQ